VQGSTISGDSSFSGFKLIYLSLKVDLLLSLGFANILIRFAVVGQMCVGLLFPFR
jgi:hypothetical protein